MTTRRALSLFVAGCLAAACCAACGQPPQQEPTDLAHLERAFGEIDDAMPGELGVYVRRLGDDAVAERDADRRWYLASTVKVPIAIAVLSEVEAGRLSLDDTLTLAESDFVDGAGDLLWQEPGTRWSIATLLEKSLVNSDSTATDMLLRHIGEDRLRRYLDDWVPGGFGPITTILQVRYDVYSLLHPAARELSNMDIVRLKNAGAGEPRLQALLETLGVPRDELRIDTIEAAFERYYEGDRNQASLEGFARLLERLVEGELLSPEHTQRLLAHMQEITTGDHRIKAGLPADVAFAQKTGTQIARACNMGVLRPDEPARAIVVAACTERFGDIADAERALAKVGGALGSSGLLDD